MIRFTGFHLPSFFLLFLISGGCITIFHLERKTKMKFRKMDDGGPASHPQSHTPERGEERTAAYQRRLSYCCAAAYRQSVPRFNMCVNDNVKGYCHALLATQNTSPLVVKSRCQETPLARRRSTGAGRGAERSPSGGVPFVYLFQRRRRRRSRL